MAGQVISKVATADGGTHLITNSFYGVCTTAATQVAKPVIIVDPDITDAITPVPGTLLTVKFTNANGGTNPTLTLYNNSGTINNPTQGSTTLLAATTIARYGTTAAGSTVAQSWRAGAVVPFIYDGARWVEASSIDDNSVYTNPTLGNGYGTCNTTATTTAKAATLTGYSLISGGRVSIRCTTSNTVSAPTMNINSKGAKAVWVEGAASSASNPALWDVGDILELVYDGTQYQIVSKSATNAEINAIINS